MHITLEPIKIHQFSTRTNRLFLTTGPEKQKRSACLCTIKKGLVKGESYIYRIMNYNPKIAWKNAKIEKNNNFHVMNHILKKN